MHKPVDVLLVDQSAMVNEKLQLVLGSMPQLKLIVEAELYRDLSGSKVIVVFVQEPGIPDTLALIARLKARLPTLRVLVAFQTLNASDLQRLLEAGADAFVMAQATPEEFYAELIALARGADLTNKPRAEVPSTDITPREEEILRFLSAGFSNKEVARRLKLSVRTIETHRLNLRRKTQTGRLNELVALARRMKLEPIRDTRTPELRRTA